LCACDEDQVVPSKEYAKVYVPLPPETKKVLFTKVMNTGDAIILENPDIVVQLIPSIE